MLIVVDIITFFLCEGLLLPSNESSCMSYLFATWFLEVILKGGSRRLEILFCYYIYFQLGISFWVAKLFVGVKYDPEILLQSMLLLK